MDLSRVAHKARIGWNWVGLLRLLKRRVSSGSKLRAECGEEMRDSKKVNGASCIYYFWLRSCSSGPEVSNVQKIEEVGVIAFS